MTGRPNLSADPLDHATPHHEPPADAATTAYWLDHLRRQLRGEALGPTPPAEPEGQLGLLEDG